jgi:hypothetical protein
MENGRQTTLSLYEDMMEKLKKKTSRISDSAHERNRRGCNDQDDGHFFFITQKEPPPPPLFFTLFNYGQQTNSGENGDKQDKVDGGGGENWNLSRWFFFILKENKALEREWSEKGWTQCPVPYAYSRITYRKRKPKMKIKQNSNEQFSMATL